MEDGTTCGILYCGPVGSSGWRPVHKQLIWQYTSALKRTQPDATGRKEAPREKFMETTTTSLHKQPATFTVRQLSPALGAEILGIDLRDPIDGTLKQRFLDA